jgi:hypothetical protein
MAKAKPQIQPDPTMPRAVLFGIAAAAFTARTPMELALSYRGLSAEDICRTINLKREGKFDYSCLLVPLESGKTSWSSDKRGITSMLNKVEEGTLELAEVVAYLKNGIDIDQEAAEKAAAGAFTEQKAAPAKRVAEAPRKTPTKTRARKKPKVVPVAAVKVVERSAPAESLVGSGHLAIEAIKQAVRDALPEIPSKGQLIDIEALTDTIDAIVLRRLNALEDRMPTSNAEALDSLQRDVNDLRVTLNDIGRMLVAANENLLTYADIVIPGAEDHLTKISFDTVEEPPEPGPVPLEELSRDAVQPTFDEEEVIEETSSTYTEEDLKAMDEDKLRKVAAGLGIPGADSAYPAVLIHKISRLSA